MTTRWRLSWRQALAFYIATDPAHALMRQQHLMALRHLVPVHVLSTLLGGASVVWALGPVVGGEAVALWYGAALLLTGVLVLLSRWLGHQAQPTPRALALLVLHAAAMGLLWSAPMVLWFAPLDAVHRHYLLVVVCTALFAGLCWYAMVPAAALAWLLAIAAGAAVPLWRTGDPVLRLMAVMSGIYVVVGMMGVQLAVRALRARLDAEREAERQGQMVALLLRDFEEHATDLLWEVDRKGRLTHVSQRLPQLLGLDTDQVLGQPVLELLIACGSEGKRTPGLALLHRAMLQDKPFRDVKVQVRLKPPAGAVRWWLFGAKPLLDERGRSNGWRGVISDITQQHEVHQRLTVLAHSDALTGLANRVQLRERVQAALDASRDGGRRSALVCIDLDNFKQINDSLGHTWGDEVLKTVARRLQGVMRRSDMVARLGGDEFAVVLDDVRSDDEVLQFCRRLLAVLNQATELRERTLIVNASIGVAMVPDHGQSIDELLSNADLALYAAKERGRARCELFAPWLGERNRRSMAISQALRGALAAGQLTLHWQPRVHIETWRVVGAEALLRWRHPELGQVPPVEFIAAAEASGQIHEIGAWVLERACTEARHRLPGMTISVNVSAMQLMGDNLLADVERALLRSGLPAHRLEIEITESIFVDDAEVALANLHGVKKLGVQVAMDDFGTGYSSLAYLRRFPFDTLKIDRAFVRELMTHRDARSIVRTIVDLANNLGMQTVAEGVEEPAQLEVLRRASCQCVQGYLVAQPLALPALEDLLATWSMQTRPEPDDELDVTRPVPLSPLLG